MSIVFTEVRIEDRGGVELSFMEGAVWMNLISASF